MIGQTDRPTPGSGGIQCPRIVREKKESSARPSTLRRNRFERHAGKHYSFRTRACGKVGWVPVGTVITRELEYPGEKREEGETTKNPRASIYEEDGGRRKVSHHVEAGRSFFYVAAAITVATDDSADYDDVVDEDVGVTRWYFGGESFTRVTEENYKKKRKEKNEHNDVSLVSKFETSRTDYSLLLRCSFSRFVHPICRLRRKKQSLFVSR